MNIRTIATLAVAVLLGIIAVFLVRTYLATPRPAAAGAGGGPTTPVVVASAPIVRGQALVGTQLKVVNFPASSVPIGTFQTTAALTGTGANARLALRAIAVNEPILADLITAPGAKMVLSTALEDGMRAVTLRDGEVPGVAGFVLPGDRIDILLTRTLPGNDQGVNAVTQAVAEDVLVLGVDQSNDDQADKPYVARVVTVEVTPAQAELLTLAQTVGALSLSLRHVKDDAPLARKVVTAAQLGYFAPATPRSAPAPAAPRAKKTAASGMSEVRVSRGVDVSTYAVTSH
jgi:pilus assembly protein CpaB